VDIEGYYAPSSNSFAYSAIEYNVQNPSPAFIVRNGNSAVTPPAWAQSFYSDHGATSTALYAGLRNISTVNNNASQNILFITKDTGGTTRSNEIFADPAGHLILNFTGLQSGSALKIQSVASCTTAATMGATCNTTITWPSAFADTNYFPLCSINAAAGAPYVVNEQGSRLAASTVIQIAATSAVAASGQLYCMGIHF
jgi:hypothetical protein